MRRPIVLVAGVASVLAVVAALWWRDRRLGAGIVNGVVNPFLVARGVSGRGPAEVGTLEHVGRRSGTRRLTPVHPVPSAEGFRIIVPLAERSEWARNVLAAGHCRLEVHGIVHELDEPVLLAADQVAGLSAPERAVSSRLGFRYLRLHRFASAPGTLAAGAEGEAWPAVGPVETTPPVLEGASR